MAGTGALRYFVTFAVVALLICSARAHGAKAFRRRAESRASLSALACPPIDECDAEKKPDLKSSTSATRIAAIKACLAKLAQPASDVMKLWAGKQCGDGVKYNCGDPINLFSWGDQAKYDSWKDKTNVFNLQKAFVQGRETAYSYKIRKSSNQTPVDEEQLLLVDKLDRKPEVHDLVQLATAAADLFMQQYQAELDKAKPEQKSDSDFTNSLSNRVMDSVQTTYGSVALMKVYPLYYDYLLHVVAFKQEAELRQPKGMPKAEWDMYKAGVEFVAKSDGGNLYDSTGGWGVYFALNAEASTAHGKVLMTCPVPSTAMIINADQKLDDACVYKAMVNANIFRTAASAQNRDLKTLAYQNIVSPNRKTLFVSPQDAEEALKGYLLSFRAATNNFDNVPPFVVDKGVIDYTKCTFSAKKAKASTTPSSTSQSLTTAPSSSTSTTSTTSTPKSSPSAQKSSPVASTTLHNN